MSKNIRVAWDDLQSGDKVHLKGSNNVYEFMEKTYVGDVVDSFVVRAPGISHVVIPRIMFDYATRPAPKKPKLHEPTLCGEYWTRSAKGWQKLILLGTFVTGKCWTMNGYRAFSWDDFVTRNHPTEILTAEEYYTRKIKGEL